MKITKLAIAFKGYASSHDVEILNSFSPELQHKKPETSIKNKLKKLLSELSGFKFVTALVLVFVKIESEDKTKYDTGYSHSKTETIINESDIDDIFESIYTTIISNIQKYLGKGSGEIVDSVIEHNISISKYNSLAGSCDFNECSKWDLVRYLNPADCNPGRADKKS